MVQKNLAIIYGQNLNNYLTQYMKTEGAQRVINSVHTLINEHQEPVANLREKLNNLLKAIQNLRYLSAGEPIHFVEGLNNIFNTHNKVLFSLDDIKKTIDSITFLRRIGSQVPSSTAETTASSIATTTTSASVTPVENMINYDVVAWSGALVNAIEGKLQQLIEAPQGVNVNGVLTLKGALVSTSDVNAAFLIHPSAASIRTYSVNTLFIDEDILAPSTSVSFVSPCMKIINGPKTIQLSGFPGDNGAHGVSGTEVSGQSGFPGKPGGHFFAKAFTFDGLKQLEVHNSGGQGGRGGNGAHGAKGADGTNGNLESFTTTPYHKVHWSPGIDYERDDYGTRTFYQDQGTDGQPGTNGGQAGQGGKGGPAGLGIIDGVSWTYQGTHGDQGADGDVGAGGQGGLHGQHCTGRIITNLRTEGTHPGVQTDTVEIPRAHQPRQPDRAPDGLPGVGLNAQAPLLEPDKQAPLVYKAILEDHNAYYVQEATNPLTSPFVKAFPQEVDEDTLNTEITRQQGTTQAEADEKARQTDNARRTRQDAQEAEANRIAEKGRVNGEHSAAEKDRLKKAKEDEDKGLLAEELHNKNLEKRRADEKEKIRKEVAAIPVVVPPAPSLSVPAAKWKTITRVAYRILEKRGAKNIKKQTISTVQRYFKKAGGTEIDYGRYSSRLKKGKHPYTETQSTYHYYKYE